MAWEKDKMKSRRCWCFWGFSGQPQAERGESPLGFVGFQKHMDPGGKSSGISVLHKSCVMMGNYTGGAKAGRRHPVL